MFFDHQEKIFSLAKTVPDTPASLTTLWEEFYCYLLLGGLFREGEGRLGVFPSSMETIHNKDFSLAWGSYNNVLARLISDGLHNRFMRLFHHADINDAERIMLTRLDHVFSTNKGWLLSVTGNDLYGISISRGFSPTMQTIARYVAVMFGFSKFPVNTTVPSLYLSRFGNIHLSQNETIVLGTPLVPYGTTLSSGEVVTPLWALMSAMVDGLVLQTYPGEALLNYVSQLGFMTQPDDYEQEVPVTTRANALRIKQLMGVDGYQRVSVAASFYHSFLYGNVQNRKVSRYGVLKYILDVMVKKTEQCGSTLFAPDSCFSKFGEYIPLGQVARFEKPPLLMFAMEALKDDAASTDPTQDTPAPDTPTPDPLPDDTAVPTDDTTTVDEDPAGVSLPPQNSTKNTIGLISFDKTGEGVDDTLYREAVVALNDRLRHDDSLPVTPEVREALDYWVNGYLYLAAVASTKDYMLALHLNKYLKNV